MFSGFGQHLIFLHATMFETALSESHVDSSLPLYLRRDISCGLFKRKLKTFLVGL